MEYAWYDASVPSLWNYFLYNVEEPNVYLARVSWQPELGTWRLYCFKERGRIIIGSLTQYFESEDDAYTAAYAYANSLEHPTLTLAECRPEVREFALWMEKQLRLNDFKPGWKGDTVHSLLRRVDDERKELLDLLRITAYEDMSEKLAKAIWAEAADVANFLMMVADVATLDGGHSPYSWSSGLCES